MQRAELAVPRTAGASGLGLGVLLLIDMEGVLPSAVRNVPCVEAGWETRAVMYAATISVSGQARSVGLWWKSECSVRGEGWGGADPKRMAVGLRRQGKILPNLTGRSFVRSVLVLGVLGVVSIGKVVLVVVVGPVVVAVLVVGECRLVAMGRSPPPVAIPVVSRKAS